MMVACLVLFASCGEYQKALKSPDPNYKFDFAKRAFEQKRYVQAYTLLKDVVTQLKGSDKAEESMYLLGLSHYENKEYPDAAHISRRITSVILKGNMPNLPVIMPDMPIILILRRRSLTSRRL